MIGDLDFHLRVAAVTDIGFIAEPLARYHLRDDRGDWHYENMITAGVERHLETDARVRGALLRRFIDADPSRLGLLVALSHDDEMARRQADRIEELVRLIDWRTHHVGNRINDMHERVIRMEGELDLVRDDVARLRRRPLGRRGTVAAGSQGASGVAAASGVTHWRGIPIEQEVRYCRA